MTGLGQRGSTLLIVLIMIAVLSVLAMETLRTGLLDRESQAVFRLGIQAEQLVLSAETVAEKLLLADSPSSDSADDIWARVPESLSGAELFETGVLYFSVEDESGRFPLSMLRNHSLKDEQLVFQNILRSTGFSGDVQAYVRALIDWQDGDGATVSGGAEVTPYREPMEGEETLPDQMAAGPPNRQVESLDELRYLRWTGMKPGQADKAFFGQDGRKGLKDLCTAYATRLNINTALPEVVKALVASPEQGELLYEDLVKRRANYGDAQFWYAPVLQAYAVKVTVAARSTVFRVRARAEAGAMQMHLESVLQRKNGTIERMYRRVY